MQSQWLRLADGAYINMGNVNAVRTGPQGQLRLEFVGEHGTSPQGHRAVSDMQDVAMIEAYLAAVVFTAGEAPAIEAIEDAG